MRDFNTAGPVQPEDHYCIPPLDRANMGEILPLVRGKRYFVLHAPRQTGKTSTLLALRDLLNGGTAGDYRCGYINVEIAQSAREDVGLAMGAIASEIAREARSTLGDEATARTAARFDTSARPHAALGTLLDIWTRAAPSPLVLLIDEIDALVGDSLVSALRQLRAGYAHRPSGFPQSVVLCGVRDVRDYRIHASSEKEVITGGSAFNIKTRSLRMGDFTQTEVRALLGQHTAATGQAFEPEAVDSVWEQTRGQPWLVNALAQEMCFSAGVVRERAGPITEPDVFEAREELIMRRETHLDQLTDKLREPRVRRVIEPLLSGGDGTYSDLDFEYVHDLGLVAADAPLRIANPIYGEVLPRVLTSVIEREVRGPSPAWYVDAAGNLDMDKLLAAFQDFFRQNSEHWIERARYTEAGPQLVLQAFLHRVVNGAGRIEREYALGSRRVDLLVIWPGEDRAEDRFVVECKLIRDGRSRAQTVEKGLEQTATYMDISRAESGHLVVFVCARAGAGRTGCTGSGATGTGPPSPSGAREENDEPIREGILVAEVRAHKTLIEVALPLDAINAASRREKSIRHGHPSTLHLWWARRPLAAARAVIFAQMVNDPSEDPDRFPTGEARSASAGGCSACSSGWCCGRTRRTRRFSRRRARRSFGVGGGPVRTTRATRAP